MASNDNAILNGNQEIAMKVICGVVLGGQAINLLAAIYITFAHLVRCHTDNALIFLFYFFIYLITIGYSITLVKYIRNPEQIFAEQKLDVYAISEIIADCALVALGVAMIASIYETTLMINTLIN